MRCLHCGRELALLKRLTGNGEFCSDQHKQSYHDEYNRLALSRLLQAQTKTDERAKTVKTEPAGTPPEGEAPMPAAGRERGPALPLPVAHKPEPVATGAAGFIPEPMTVLEGPAPEAFSAASPLSWVPGPVFPVFNQVQPLQIETPPEDPPLADLLALPINPIAETGPAPVQTSEAGPFGDAPPFYPRREDGVRRDSFELPMAGPVTLPGIAAVAPGVPELFTEDSQQPFFPEIFQLLVPSPPHASSELEEAGKLHVSDGELALPSGGQPNLAQEQKADSGCLPEPKAETGVDSLHVDSLHVDSLQMLQSGLRPKAEPGPPRRSGRRTELPAVSGPVVDRLALDSLFPPPSQRASSGAHVNVNAQSEGSVATLQRVDVEAEVEAEVEKAAGDLPVVSTEATAPFMEQVLPITLRIVSPAKARLVSESRPLLVPCNPQLTTTEILPLRPRIGIGRPPEAPTPDGPPKCASAVPASNGPGGVVKVTAVRNTAQPPRNEAPFDPREAVLAVKRSVHPPEMKSAPVQPRVEEAVQAEIRNPEPETEPEAAAGLTPDPAPVTSEPMTSEAIKAPTPKKPVAAPQARQQANQAEPPNAVSGEIPVPGAAIPGARDLNPEQDKQPDFGPNIGTPENQRMLSRLPLAAKIGIAIALLLAIAAAGYMIFSRPGKSPSLASVHATSVTNLTEGDGGWIADWAGDTTGNHKGRKISLYRPSLNLTNYQIEFQGKIESNSLGWVFRALNGSNFYAVKLAATGAGYRLLKYAVVDGKEKETGQVPVRPVNGNTFPIRFEVRGDRFTTFIGSNPVDTWVDGQLKSGGLGFLLDRADRAEITKVGISLLPGSRN